MGPADSGTIREAQRWVRRAAPLLYVNLVIYGVVQLFLLATSRSPAVAIALLGVFATTGITGRVGRRAPAVREVRVPPGVPSRAAVSTTAHVERPSGNVVFLFTDIVDSTALWETDPGAMGEALRLHDRMLQHVVDRRDGVVFTHAGDGFGAAFRQAHDAVVAAVEVQRAVCAVTWPSGLDLRVRIGINLGQADERDADYFGPPVNRAARVTSVAQPGEILVTDLVVEAARATPVRFRSRGTHRLRGIRAGVDLYAVEPQRSAP